MLPKIPLFSRWSKTSTWRIGCQTYREASGGALYVFRCTFCISCSRINSRITGKRRHPDVKSADIWWMPAVCLLLPSSHPSRPSHLQGCHRRSSTSGLDPIPSLFCSPSSLLTTLWSRPPPLRKGAMSSIVLYIPVHSTWSGALHTEDTWKNLTSLLLAVTYRVSSGPTLPSLSPPCLPL